MKKLRIKIVLGVLLSSTVVFLLTIFIIWLAAIISASRSADFTTSVIASHNGTLPPYEEIKQLLTQEGMHLMDDAESPYRARYFYVSYKADGVTVNTDHIAAVDEDEAIAMAESVMTRTATIGYYENFRYRVSLGNGIIVFLDNTDVLNSLRTMMLIIGLIALAFILMITLVFLFLSNRIVKPFEENARMQKQFITDASHELKTPLAIISANAEVLAYKYGENEWIDNITAQVTRVSDLVNELLTLNRLEEVDEITDIKSVNLSQTVNDIAVTFEEVLLGKNAVLHRRIQPDVVLNGNPAQLERLVSVLTENASKYVSENGEVVITLKQEMRHTVFSVFNTCAPDPEVDYSHLFDRFYRPDSSRTSQTGGHGIGLSIAKRIVTLHNGSIEAIPGENGMTFQVKLSNRLKVKKKTNQK